MIELLINAHPALQIFALMLMIVGGIVLYKFKWIVIAIGTGAVGIWVALRKGK